MNREWTLINANANSGIRVYLCPSVVKKKDSSGNLVASFRHQIELSAVEQNSQAVVLEISKSPGGGLDELDPAVESFCSCISYSMPEITE